MTHTLSALKYSSTQKKDHFARIHSVQRRLTVDSAAGEGICVDTSRVDFELYIMRKASKLEWKDRLVWE